MKEKVINFIKNKKNLSIGGGIVAVALVLVVVIVISNSKNDSTNETTKKVEASITTDKQASFETTVDKEIETTTEETTTVTETTTHKETTVAPSTIVLATTTPVAGTTPYVAPTPTTQPQPQPTTAAPQPTTMTYFQSLEKAENTPSTVEDMKKALANGGEIIPEYNKGAKYSSFTLDLLVPTTKYVYYKTKDGVAKKANCRGYYAVYTGPNCSFPIDAEQCPVDNLELREPWEVEHMGKTSDGMQQVGNYDGSEHSLTNQIMFFYYYN